MESRLLTRSQPAVADASPEIVWRASDEQAEESQASASSSLLKPSAQLTMDRFLQDLPNAEQPHVDFPPQYHTGRVPNSKAGDGKPRLLLMGQRRWVTSALLGNVADGAMLGVESRPYRVWSFTNYHQARRCI